jgi:hypothetical protein
LTKSETPDQKAAPRAREEGDILQIGGGGSMTALHVFCIFVVLLVFSKFTFTSLVLGTAAIYFYHRSQR